MSRGLAGLVGGNVSWCDVDRRPASAPPPPFSDRPRPRPAAGGLPSWAGPRWPAWRGRPGRLKERLRQGTGAPPLLPSCLSSPSNLHNPCNNLTSLITAMQPYGQPQQGYCKFPRPRRRVGPPRNGSAPHIHSLELITSEGHVGARPPGAMNVQSGLELTLNIVSPLCRLSSRPAGSPSARRQRGLLQPTSPSTRGLPPRQAPSAGRSACRAQIG